MHWYVKAIKSYAVFRGRASRSEYWWFILPSLFITLVLIWVDFQIGTMNRELGLGLLSGIFDLGMALPYISVSIRRLHDTGRSGWLFLLSFIPLVNIAYLVLMILDSQQGDNRYGPYPK